MRMRTPKSSWLGSLSAALVFAALAIATPRPASAHCDSLDGPVVQDARTALAEKDVTPVLKWVRAQDETAIREAFRKTLTVREAGPEAKALADRWFFETIVRVHRASEGAPFTGLKPAGSDVGEAVRAADRSLAEDEVEPVVTLVTVEAARGIRHRYHAVADARKHMGDSVAKGRAYVAAYVDYVHYVDGLYGLAAHGPGHHAGPEEGAEGESQAAPGGCRADHAGHAEHPEL